MPISKKLLFKIVMSSAVGTVLEWYDFTLFAFLTPLIAIHFFPQQDRFAAQMLTYAIFAIGFFVRPIGAIIFGHIGDKIGRKKALLLSILVMASATFLIGLLPTYNTIGIYAPLLLISLRLCQGLSAGGESTGAVLFALEAHHHKYHGFLAALLWSFVGVGMLLGSFAASITTTSSAPWAWRVPFLLGIVTGILGFFVRRRTPESLQFQKAVEKGEISSLPLYACLRHHKIKILRIIGLYSLSAMVSYVVFVFISSYASTILGMPLATVSFIGTMGLAAGTLLIPFGGLLSDFIGRKKVLIFSALGFLLFSYPLFKFMSYGDVNNLIIAEAIFVIFAVGYQGTISITTVELLPISIRYSAMAVGYNIAYSLFGGTAPIVAGYLVKFTGDKAAPGWYLTMGAVFALLSLWNMRLSCRLG